jgi:multidrug efflux system membrane fusion protein
MRRLALLVLLAAVPAAAEPLVVRPTEIKDRKAVIVTVEPVHQLVARKRIGETIAALMVKQGDDVKAGETVAEVSDEKLALQMQALGSRIASQPATRDQANTEYDRISELARRGVSNKMQLDQAKTSLDVAERNLAAMQGDRRFISQKA